MKRVAIACSILVLLIIGCFAGYRAITETISSTQTQITQTTAHLDAGELGQAMETLSQSYGHWTDSRFLLAALVDHQVLDEVDALYQRAAEIIRIGSTEDARPTLRMLAAALDHITETERLTLANIL